MRALIQRVSRCSVIIDGSIHSSIGSGMLVLLGVKEDDTEGEAEYLAKRCVALRIFEDSDGKMNLSVQDTGGSMMVVSQFTLYGDTKKGNRPSYTQAASSDIAESCYNAFIDNLKKLMGDDRIASGVFRAMMQVDLVNDGPVTLMIESKNGQ